MLLTGQLPCCFGKLLFHAARKGSLSAGPKKETAIFVGLVGRCCILKRESARDEYRVSFFNLYFRFP